jgi:hypothetical protein
MVNLDFVSYPKIPRLSRECIITEKIDGTNAQIYIAENNEPFILNSGRVVPFLCGSRSRWIYPESDNHGFARWAYENVEELLKLGPGHHFGEFWGKGIQRGYGLQEKRFSLFNVAKWSDPEVRPKCCHVVPKLELVHAIFNEIDYNQILGYMKVHGSFAAPGFMNPEGIVIFHKASGYLFKKTIEKDEKAKGE